METYDVVKKLIGEVRPVGETTTDDTRYENLKALVDLTNKLLIVISAVATEKNQSEFSRRRAGQFADEYLTTIGWD